MKIVLLIILIVFCNSHPETKENGWLDNPDAFTNLEYKNLQIIVNKTGVSRNLTGAETENVKEPIAGIKDEDEEHEDEVARRVKEILKETHENFKLEPKKTAGNSQIVENAGKTILNEDSKKSLQILCVKAISNDLKDFDIYDNCIIEKGGFGYCFNHLGKENLCNVSVGIWNIEQVEYLPRANCGTWITKTSNGCKVVLASGYYSEHEMAFYAKSAFRYLFWKGKKADTITLQLRNSKKPFSLKSKYLHNIYFHDDL